MPFLAMRNTLRTLGGHFKVRRNMKDAFALINCNVVLINAKPCHGAFRSVVCIVKKSFLNFEPV